MATVLVVDDRPDHREQVRSALGDRGHRVIEACGCADALAAVRGEHPDLVVADPLLPDLAGYELVRELRADPDTASTPVLFATAGYLEHAARPMAEACGATGVVLDTDDPGPLAAAVEAALAEPAGGDPSSAVPSEVGPGQLRAVNARLARRVRELEAELADRPAAHSAAPSPSPSPSRPVGEEMLAPTMDEVLDGVAWRHGTGPDQRPAPAPGPAPDRAPTPDGAGAADGDSRLAADAWLRTVEQLDTTGRLAAEVGHDFNNVLSVILTYCRSAADTAADGLGAGGLDAEASRLILDDLERVLRAGERAAHLNRRLLAFGGRDGARPRAVDLAALLAWLEPTLVRTLGDRAELVLRGGPSASTGDSAGLPPVLADESQLTQVLMDLALDAHDALTGGGTVVFALAAHRQPAGAPGEGTRARMTVGPAEGDYVRLTVSHRAAAGSGALAAGRAMASVRSTVQQAGGDVLVEPDAADGPAVHVLLPVAQEPAGGPHGAAAGPGQGPAAGAAGGPAAALRGSETVLLVDDEDDLRELVARTLRRAGYHVLTAADGTQALAEADRYRLPIHLLLTDVCMPGMLGRELAERLLPLRPGLRVIFMSGYAPAIMAAPGLYGLSKPFSELSLLSSVRGILDANG